MDPDLEHDDLLAGEEPEPSAPDPAAALAAVAECLRHLAYGYGLDPREREACLRLLQRPLPRAGPADIDAARKILEQAGQRRMGVRARDRASKLFVRLAELAAAAERAA
jgi:hypothetical protein